MFVLPYVHLYRSFCFTEWEKAGASGTIVGKNIGFVDILENIQSNFLYN